MKYLILLLFLTACEPKPAVDPLAGFKCNAEQLKAATLQYELCNKSYFGSYCIEKAMKAHCEVIK